MWTDLADTEWSPRLRRGSREWRAVRKGLLRLSGDRDVRGWEYLQSFRDRGRWVHELVHRHHPVKRCRWYLHVPASDGWTPAAERGTVH